MNFYEQACNLPANLYPVVIEAFRPDGSLAWRRKIERPGPLTRAEIPQSIGCRMRVTFGDGEVWESTPTSPLN